MFAQAKESVSLLTNASVTVDIQVKNATCSRASQCLQETQLFALVMVPVQHWTSASVRPNTMVLTVDIIHAMVKETTKQTFATETSVLDTMIANVLKKDTLTIAP